MRELDRLLDAYLDGHYAAAPAEQRRAFAALLEQPDPLLWDYCTGRARPDDAAALAVVAQLRRAR